MNKRSAQISRQTILETATRVFADRGYTRTNMRGIAQTAGISVGGLYLHFRSKELLYLTLLEQWMDDLNRRTMVAMAATTSAPEALKAFIRISLEFARSHREVLVQGRDAHICGGHPLREFFHHRRTILAEIIRDGMDTGVFSPCQPQEAARVIFCTLRGFFASMAHDDDALFSPDDFASLILNGLMAPPTLSNSQR